MFDTINLPDGTIASPRRNTYRESEEHIRTHSPSGKPGHCVHEICTCAKHQCKPAWKPNPAKFDANSTYAQDFDAKPLDRKVAVRPQNTYKATPFEGQSTNQADFKAWEVQKNTSFKPRASTGPHVPFDAVSSYKNDFNQKDMPERMVRSGATYKPNPAHFDGMTTSKEAYVAHPHQERTTFSPSRAVGRSVPFEGNSNYRDNFQKWDLPERNAVQKKEHHGVPDDRDFGSTYGTSFVKHEQPTCPMHKLPAAPCVPAGREHVYYDEQEQRWY